MCNHEQWQMLTIWDVTSFSFSNVCWVLYMFEICMWLEKKPLGMTNVTFILFYCFVLQRSWSTFGKSFKCVKCQCESEHKIPAGPVWFSLSCFFSSHMQCKYLRFLFLMVTFGVVSLRRCTKASKTTVKFII